MRLRPLFSAALAVLVGAAAALASRPASAGNVACKTLPKPVYVTGSGKVTSALLGQALGPSGVTIVYRTEASCLAVNAIVNGTAIVTTPTDLSATYWDMTGKALACDLDAAGTLAQIGISDVFPSTCPNPQPNGLPSNVRDFLGPIESYVFVVPKTSTQLSISKAAGYFVYGFGTASGAAPWTDQTEIFQRDPTSGSQLIMSVAIGVPATKFAATPTVSSADMVTTVSTATNAEGAIGFLSGEVTSISTAQVNSLAYQDADQACGYWPDSTANASDKRNVRDGHYQIWGPLHLLTTVDAQGYPTDANAKAVIAYLTGTLDLPGGFDLLSLLAKAGIVPECAMHVQRDTELGPLASFQPERSCSCYFDQAAGATPACMALWASSSAISKRASSISTRRSTARSASRISPRICASSRLSARSGSGPTTSRATRPKWTVPTPRGRKRPNEPPNEPSW